MAIKVNEVGNVNTYSNVQPKVSFKAENETPVNTEQKPDTFEKEGMSTGTKTVITIGSLLALLGIGFGIKKHLDTKAANKALKEAAQAVGISDTKLFKQMQELFGKVVKHDGETIEINDVLAKIDILKEKGLLKEGDRYIIMNPKKTQELFGKEYNGAELPENTIATMIERVGEDGNKKYACRELILNKGYGETLAVYPEDNLIFIPIEL